MVNRHFIYHARQPPGRVAGYPGKFLIISSTLSIFDVGLRDATEILVLPETAEQDQNQAIEPAPSKGAKRTTPCVDPRARAVE